MCKVPTEVYMLRHKETGEFYTRRYYGTPLVWTSIQGPASAKGSIPPSERDKWERVTLRVVES